MNLRPSLTLLTGLIAAAVAMGALAADLPPDVLFRGVRMGMAKTDMLRLPQFKDHEPQCTHVIISGQPRNTRVALCTFVDKGPSGQDLSTTYVLSTDPTQVERVINFAIRGEASDAPWALTYLKARFGDPSYEAIRRQLGADGKPQRATVWQIAGKQVMFREKCKTTVTFCVDYSDSPFARQITQQLGDI